MNFWIKTPTGNFIDMLCDRLEPIGMMKTFIQEKTKTPVRALIFAGKQLDDCRTLDDYNISKDDYRQVSAVFALCPVIEKTSYHCSGAGPTFFPDPTSPQKIIGEQVVKFVEAMGKFLETQKQAVWDNNAASSFVASALSGMIKSPQDFTEGLSDPYRYPPEVANYIRMYVTKNPSLQKVVSENTDYAVALKNRLAKGEFAALKEELSMASRAGSAQQIAKESKCSLM